MFLQVLPLNRIKRLMKEEADVKAVAADASYAAARATVCSPLHKDLNSVGRMRMCLSC